MSTKIQPVVFNSSFYKVATGVADHYGFKTLDQLKSEYKDKKVQLPKISRDDMRADALGGEFVRSMKTCLQHNMLRDNTPKFFYHTTGVMLPKTKNPQATFGLEAVGVKSGIAEATVLKAALSILEELGTPAHVSINSIGDTDSAARFQREINNFLRKNMSELSPDELHLMKDDSLKAFQKATKRADTLRDNAPRPVEFLSKDSRRHFREVLECLETIGIPYDIDNTLLGNHSCYSQVLFQIKQEVEDEEEKMKSFVLARGGRYDEMARKFFKSIAPAVGLLFSLPREKKEKNLATKHRRPKLAFVHLGIDAQRQSLMVSEELRRAKIPVIQRIGCPSLSDQLSYAKASKVPQVIIMGQKEVNEGTVIIRNVETSAQQIVPRISLIQVLKQGV